MDHLFSSLNIFLKEITQTDISFGEELYSLNTTDPHELHSFEDSSLNYLYLTNFDFFNDLNNYANYFEVDATSWIWPNYASQINGCRPQLPTFMISELNTIKIGTNIQSNLSFVPYEHCQNSKFIIRVWLNDPIKDTFWVSPAWVLVDQLTSSIRIDTTAITQVGSYHLTFQSQLIVDPSDFIDASFYTTTDVSLFNFENQNWQLVSSTNDGYVVKNVLKKYTLTFSDLENDQIMIKIVNDGGLDVFVQPVNSSSFDFDIKWSNCTGKIAQLSFIYTDIHHIGLDAWKTASIIVNIFGSEPPRYASTIPDIVLSTCYPQNYVQELPNIIDPDSTLVSLLFENGTSDWVKIVNNSKVIFVFEYYD